MTMLSKDLNGNTVCNRCFKQLKTSEEWSKCRSEHLIQDMNKTENCKKIMQMVFHNLNLPKESA